jgi:hypothetical protein
VTHDDDPPELRGYVPHEHGRPLRHPATLPVMRVVIVLGILGLVVPGLYATVVLQNRLADAHCAAIVTSTAPGYESVPRFEVAGPGGPSWYCYARDFSGHEVLVESLGLFPG